MAEIIMCITMANQEMKHTEVRVVETYSIREKEGGGRSKHSVSSRPFSPSTYTPPPPTPFAHLPSAPQESV